MATGFTLQAVANRIRSMDNQVQWKAYVAACALARLRGTKKASLAIMVFGAKEKPSKTFDNSWTIAGKLFAAGLSPSQKATITALPIDEGHKAMLEALAAHMTALGVDGKNAYDAVAEYASKEEIPAQEEPTPPPAEEPAGPIVSETIDASPTIELEGSDEEPWTEAEIIAGMMPHLEKMSLQGLLDLGSVLGGLIQSRQAEAMPLAA